MTKITRATFKSFVKKNETNLMIKVKSEYDGMVDGISLKSENKFTPIKRSSDGKNNLGNTNLGFEGVWLVGDSRDYFKEYSDDNYIGIETTNCCGRFIVAISK